MICNLIDKVYTNIKKLEGGIECEYSYTDLLLQSFNNGKCLDITSCEEETICTPIQTISCNINVDLISSAITCGNLTITQI